MSERKGYKFALASQLLNMSLPREMQAWTSQYMHFIGYMKQLEAQSEKRKDVEMVTRERLDYQETWE
jgi:hypothetical protein